MYDPHRRAFANTKNTKLPKVRFKPGQYVEQKSNKQLYEIKLVYRTAENIHEWMYILEERKNLRPVGDALSSMLEAMQSKVVKSLPMNERVVAQPVKDSYSAYDLIGNDYCHGDRIIASNKKMLNDFVLVSSGSLEA